VLSGESAVASIKLSFLMLMSVFATANNGVGKKLSFLMLMSVFATANNGVGKKAGTAVT